MSWIEIFNPGYRHTVEERERKRIEAQKPGSEGNPLGVDLEKGVVHIVMPAPAADQGEQHKPDGERNHGSRATSD